jgi:D-aspartate ligase
MKGAPTPPAVVLGGGVNGLGVVRSLGRRGIPVSLIERDTQDIATRSRYVRDFREAPEDPESLLHTLLDRSLQGAEPSVLIYTSDRFLTFVSRFREQLAERYRFVIADPDAVATLVNKDAFGRFTDAQGLPAPRTMVVSSETPLPRLASLSFPVVIKPRLSFEWRTAAFADKFGAVKSIRCDTAARLVQMLPRLEEYTSGLLVQEEILGRDDAHFSVYSYRSPHSREIVRLCVNRQRLWPIHYGAGSHARIVSNPEMEEIGSALLDALSWVGVASICFKVERRTGQAMIHEVNARLPQLHGIFQAAGIDLPYLMYLDALALPLSALAEPRLDVSYRIFSMDCSALSAYRRAGDISRRRLLGEAFRVEAIAEFARDDWGPALVAMRRGVPSLLRGLL